jgi:hypothetical protein
MKFPATDIEFAMQEEIDRLKARIKELEGALEAIDKVAWFDTKRQVYAMPVATFLLVRAALTGALSGEHSPQYRSNDRDD